MVHQIHKHTHTIEHTNSHAPPHNILVNIARRSLRNIYINAFQCVSHLMSRTAATESIVRSVRALVAEVTTCVCACVCRFLLSISFSSVAKTAPNVLPTDNLAHAHAPANVCDRITLKLERLSSQRTHIHTHTHPGGKTQQTLRLGRHFAASASACWKRSRCSCALFDVGRSVASHNHRCYSMHAI